MKPLISSVRVSTGGDSRDHGTKFTNASRDFFFAIRLRSEAGKSFVLSPSRTGHCTIDHHQLRHSPATPAGEDRESCIMGSALWTFILLDSMDSTELLIRSNHGFARFHRML